jgi:predicted component of type VI protein secretion system
VFFVRLAHAAILPRMPELVVFLRSREVNRVPILQSEVVIGRDEDADVVIDNPGVSRKHAVIAYADEVFVVRDAGSHNGITVNGRKVEHAELNDGDIVGINKFKIHFRASGGVPPPMLAAPTREVGGGKNVVATMNVDAAAAVRMQQDFLRAKQAELEARRRQTDTGHAWVWMVAAAALGISAVALYLALR